MNKLMIAAAGLMLVTGSPAVAEPPGVECPPERVVDALADAVARVAPLFRKPQAGPTASPPRPLSRDEWREQIIAQGREFCAKYPSDRVCGEAAR